jgi:hypothetical protein
MISDEQLVMNLEWAAKDSCMTCRTNTPVQDKRIEYAHVALLLRLAELRDKINKLENQNNLISKALTETEKALRQP